MATDITPLSTLYDHPNVFRIPKHGEVSKPAEKKQDSILTEEEEPDLTDVEQARNAVKTALEGRKYGSLNDMLIPAPERPEFDQERAEKAKKLTKKAAIIQLIDSLAGIGELAAGGDSTIVAPVDYSDLGFEALNQLAGLDEQYQIDLRDFNRQKQEVDRENQRIRQGVREHNQNIDLELAERNLDQAFQERQEHYEAALRYISQGKIALAQAHLNEAGLSPDGTLKKKSPSEVETPLDTPSNAEKETSTIPSPEDDQKLATRQAQAPEQSRVNSSKHAKMSTLEGVLDAIEGSLADNPDEGTKQELLKRWKDVTSEYLTLHEEVDDGSVGWWTERLYDELLTGLETRQLSNEQSESDESKKKTTFMDLVKFWPRVFNFFAKVFQHPVTGKKNQESFQDFIGTADLENQKSWSELREAWKDNQEALLNEYLPDQLNGEEIDSPKSGVAEKQTLHQIQDAIGNSLAGELDSATRIELTRRWIKNNERLLELERPDLTEQERHTLSLEMFPQMIKEKQTDRQSDSPARETIEPPTDLQPDRDRDSRSRLEIQDMRNSGQI